MPFDFFKHGDSIATAPEAQVVANPTAQQSTPPIETDRFCRNGQHPNATLQNQILSAANACALYRSKEVFSGCTNLQGDSSGGAGDRVRWRFAMRSGPYTHGLYCVVVMIQPTSGFTSNTYGRLDLATNTAGTPVVASQTFLYGNDPTNGSAFGWNYVKVVQNFVEINPSTDYYGTFNDVDNGIIQSACIFELASLTEHFSGYNATNITTGSSVVGLHRQNPVTINNALWQGCAAQVLNYSVNLGASPHTTTSATATNIVDGTSTTISASTPGYTLNLTGKARASQTSGVPVIMKAFAKNALAAETSHVYLKDSGGTTIATCTFTGAGATTAGWVSSGSFNLPASSAKYDLMYDTNGTFSFYAVSVYENG